MNPSVYLAGPIRGLNYTGATDWRDHASAVLKDCGIQPFSPMRSKAYLRDHADVGGGVLADSYEQYPLSTMKAIVARDRNDCMRSGAVLMNLLGAKTVSIGSVLEIAWADAARVPVVLVIEPSGNLHEHGMIREMCGVQVTSLDEGIKAVVAILKP